jgi:hypothetical protein
LLKNIPDLNNLPKNQELSLKSLKKTSDNRDLTYRTTAYFFIK